MIASFRRPAGLAATASVLLAADRRSLEDEDRAAQCHTRLLLGLARLYKALGGGWEVGRPAAAASTALRR